MGADAPFTTLAAGQYLVQGRKASRLFINDNLAWDHGAHELRFGTNTRIFRLNDYELRRRRWCRWSLRNFAEFITAWHRRRRKTFPRSRTPSRNNFSKPRSVTRRTTWKGLRGSPDVRHARHATMPIRSIRTMRWRGFPGPFASIPHDVNQSLDAEIQTGHRKHLRVDAPRDSATENRVGLSDRVEDCTAERVRSLQRPASRKRGRFGGRESSVLSDLPKRSIGNRRRNDHRSGSARQRRRCDGRR